MALIDAAKHGYKDRLPALAKTLIAEQNEENQKLAQQLADKEADLEVSRQRTWVLKTARDDLEEKLQA